MLRNPVMHICFILAHSCVHHPSLLCVNYNYDPTRHTIGVSLPFYARDWVFEQKNRKCCGSW